ncbi:IclR family transcriptional regulator [Saccharopolyspora sp. MS10]|uniref:IclR family transcriptional regulator n=1 Tax=Saccharopolyspora sp. MS10 TaxID=3385973 RepID=UPI0039A1DBA8
MATPGEPADLTNKSVVKAVRLLRALAHQNSGASATELASMAGIARPTAFRLLFTLEREGLVDRAENTYTLGWEMARLGKLADPYAGLVSRVRPALDDLAAELGETVTLAVPNLPLGYDLVAEVAGPHMVGVSLRESVGRYYPLHASSTGKIILAELSEDEIRGALPATLEAFTERTIVDRDVLLQELREVREQGYAVIDNELEAELLSLSRPVRDGAGELTAVLTVDGPRYRFGRDRIPSALQSMKLTAELVADMLWQSDSGD